MSRKIPRNRVLTETHKIKFRDAEGGGSIYLQFDRPPIDENGLVLGPVAAIRIRYKHAKGSEIDGAFDKASDIMSREVQTVEVRKALQGRA